MPLLLDPSTIIRESPLKISAVKSAEVVNVPVDLAEAEAVPSNVSESITSTAAVPLPKIWKGVKLTDSPEGDTAVTMTS